MESVEGSVEEAATDEREESATDEREDEGKFGEGLVRTGAGAKRIRIGLIKQPRSSWRVIHLRCGGGFGQSGLRCAGQVCASFR